MHISIRSHLITGTAAMVGMGAIALTPVTGPNLDLSQLVAPVHTEVGLSALANPIDAIILSSGLAYSWLALPTPLADYPPDYPITTYGLLPGIAFGGLAGPFPVVRQLTANILDYASVAIAGQLDAVSALVDGAVYAPAGLLNAALLALDGEFETALDVLTATLIDPIVDTVTASLSGLLYPVAGIIQRGAAALAATVELLVATVQSVIRNTGLVFTAVQNTFDGFFDNLTDGNLEGAWNFAVNGLLGLTLPNADGSACTSTAACRPAIPAQLTRSTIGAQAGWPFSVNPIQNSLRADISGGIQGIADALSQPVDPFLAAPASTVPSPAAARVVTEAPTDSGAIDPSPAAEDEAPAAPKPEVAVLSAADVQDVVVADVPTPAVQSNAARRSATDNASAGDPAPAEKSVSKHRQSRKAAKAAASAAE